MTEARLRRGARVPTSISMFARLLASFLLVVSLVLAPAGMSTAMAQPAAHASHHEANGHQEAGGHHGDSVPGEDEKSTVHMSCASCTALAAADGGLDAVAPPLRALPLGKGPPRLTGVAPERETPPPRTAPEKSL